MPLVQITLHLPTALWHAVQALAPHDGDTNMVVLRAVEDYVATAAKNQDNRSGKYQALVKTLSTPVADLHLSARPASALKTLKVSYVYELVQKSPLDLFRLPNFGEKSLREVKEKFATLGLTLGMTLDDDAYRAAIVATVAAAIEATRGVSGMVTGADRRRVARLTVPRRWGGGDLELHLVRLRDLSPRGARITHREPLHAGGIGVVDLPPALGAVRLTGRLVWTRLRRIGQTRAGDRRPLYESGLEFTSLTPDQQTALTAALARLQAAPTATEEERLP